MRIFGKPLAEYFSFQKWILALIIVVGIGRLALSLAGLPNSSVKWISVTGALIVGLLYCAIQVPRTNFGSYRHLLPLFVIQGVLSQLIVVIAIILAIQTGADNIFSAPEYSGNVDGKNWGHVGAHLVVGFLVGPLIGWLLSSGIMFVVKKLSPRSSTGPAAA